MEAPGLKGLSEKVEGMTQEQGGLLVQEEDTVRGQGGLRAMNRHKVKVLGPVKAILGELAQDMGVVLVTLWEQGHKVVVGVVRMQTEKVRGMLVAEVPLKGFAMEAAQQQIYIAEIQQSVLVDRHSIFPCLCIFLFLKIMNNSV